MSLFVKEAQPPPGCGRHKWPDSHGPADNRQLGAGFFPRGAVPVRTSGGREKGSGTSSLSETPLLTARGSGRCCPSRPAGARLASRRDGASRGRRAPGSTGAGRARRQRCREGLNPFTSPRPRRGARGDLKLAPEEKGRPFLPDLATVRAHPVAPHELCRSRSRLRTPGNLRAAGSAGGTALSGTGAGPLQPVRSCLSGPCTERQEKPSRARWERGWGWQPLGSPAEGSRQPARTFCLPRPPSRTI